MYLEQNYNPLPPDYLGTSNLQTPGDVYMEQQKFFMYQAKWFKLDGSIE